MPSVTLERAQAELPDLIRGLKPGDELVITENGVSLATVTPTPPDPPARRVPGLLKGMIIIPEGDEDDDSHLAGFAEYMS